MNVYDYFFSESKKMNSKFILNKGEDISFKELHWKSLSLAHYISKKIGENNKIILISHNSIFFIISYLAIIKSKNICVPLNPSIEQDNFNYIENAIQCNLLFVSDSSKLKLNIKNEIIDEPFLNEVLNSYATNDTNDIEENLSDISFDENRLAEILFTSGSTGIPKGVMLSHLNLRSNTDSILSYLKLSSADSMLLVLPLYYCYGLSILHTHLKVGASIVFNNNFILMGTVIDNLIKYECSGFAGVPSHFQMLLRKSQTFKNTTFPHLRYVTQAGGKLHEAFIKEFTLAFPSVCFYVMYGQTEATARLTYLAPSSLKTKIGSIGKPISGVSLNIVDENNKRVKNGEIGEIIVKGNNIMIGYLNDLKGTNETLRDGWLHTGDLGRIDEDGFVFLIGRKKNIIKIGGERISAKEIEEVIVSIPEIIDCTVLAIGDELLGEAIKAKVVINDSSNQQELKTKILKLCKQKLSKNKTPKVIEFASKLHLNSIGKKVVVYSPQK